MLSNPQNGQDASKTLIVVTGVAMLVLFALCVYLLVALWPSKVTFAQATGTPTPTPSATPLPGPTTVPAIPGQNAGEWDTHASIFGRTITVPTDARFLWIVALAAALGSFIQIGTSFSTFLGNRQFRASWIWWYILRIPIGMALGLLFYFAVRGGFFTSVSTADIQPYGIAALGGLVGMFSKQASDKLQDVFEELFKSDQDKARADKLILAPRLASYDPVPVPLGTTAVQIKGAGFASGATATINGNARTADVVDPQTLNLTLSPSDVNAPGTLKLIVANPGGGPSAPFDITVQ